MTVEQSAQARFLSVSELPRNALSPAEQAVLDTVNQKVAAAESLERIVDFLFESTQSIFPCDRIGLAFVEEDGRRVVAHHAKASYEPLLLKKGYAEDLGRGSLARVLAAGAPRIIDDLERYLAAHPESASTRLLLREGVRSSMTCPLVVEGRNVGLLFRSSRRLGAYRSTEAALHLAVAERLSQAVEKALRIEQLVAANRAYTEMLGFVSHELKSPLAGIVMDANVLTEGFLGELQPAQRDKVKKMVVKAEYLLGLIRDYLDLARLESGELALRAREDLDLVAEVVQPAIDITAPLVAEKSMRLATHLPAAPLLAECDPGLLQIVLVNLLGNAAKYGDQGGYIDLTVERREKSLRVAVRNTGPGFPAGERGRLFRKFSRLDSPELRKRKGTGVGLYTSWRIVALHSGVFDASSREGEWAEFAFEIPQPLKKEV